MISAGGTHKEHSYRTLHSDLMAPVQAWGSGLIAVARGVGPMSKSQCFIGKGPSDCSGHLADS